MRKFIILLLLFSGYHAYPTHIVGGEFEIIHLENYNYRVNMILYFDDIYGDPRAEDPFVGAYIFSKRTDEIMRYVSLENIGSTFVPYTNMECAIGELVTRRILYETTITLDSTIYTDPLGYYISWERCCRNNVINNIINPNETGQTFYLEFPPVVMNNAQFINSSPVLFPPLSDYACVNEFYYVDFGGLDYDGDSLVYTMAHPIAGNSSPIAPVLDSPLPAPYPLVNWNPGISTFNAIPGAPSLNISTEGLLTVKPSQTGLFVFSVMCEEFRAGVKIGEIRRDFQMLVIDCPPPGNKPELLVKPPGSDIFVSQPDTIFFASNEEKCLEFIARDKDTLENLNFRVKTVNFNANLNANLSIRNKLVRSPGDSVNVAFCFPDCPFVFDEPQIVDIIVGDDTCPLPLLDTVRLVVMIEPPPNIPAQFDTTANELNYSIREGEIIDLNVSAYDVDYDSLVFSVLGLNIDTADFGLNFNVVKDSLGKLDVSFNWDSSCNIYDFNDTQDLSVLLLIDDLDYCDLYEPDSIIVNIHVDLPPNTAPSVVTDLGKDSVAVKVSNELSFELFAEDTDQDQITLTALGTDFDLDQLNFTPVDISSTGTIQTTFSWSLGCYTTDLENKDNFEVLFVVEDNDKCKIRNADTISVTFQALLPDNQAPKIEIPDNEINIIAGDSIALNIIGTDPDSDSVYVYLLDPFGSMETTNAHFTPVNGIGKLTTSFNWQTSCNDLLPGLADGIYTYQLVIRDNKCLVPKSDTVDLNVTVKNKEVDFEDVFIPNVFTPNEDGFNDYFEVENLPPDNCRSQFISIAIVNRYGKRVFLSEERNFKWYAGNVNPGVFFYQIKYTENNYKGWLRVLY